MQSRNTLKMEDKDRELVTVETDEKKGDQTTNNEKKPSKMERIYNFLCPLCKKIIYLIISSITFILCIIILVLAVSSAIISRSYSSQESGRVAAMIVLAVTAAITIASSAFAFIAVCRNGQKSLVSTAVVLFIIAILQAVIASTSVRVTPYDEQDLSRSLIESFRLTKEHYPRHSRLWSATQDDLKCCGVYGPDDYRLPSSPLADMPPDVPISCCPSYDSDRSEILQETAREKCKALREYRKGGCLTQVNELFQTTSHIVMGFIIILIVSEVIQGLFGVYLARKAKHDENKENAERNKA